MNISDTFEFQLPQEKDTLLLGQNLAKAVDSLIYKKNDEPVIIEPNFKIYLSGELGSGKTSLAREFLRTFGVTGRIKSPTYTLLETYKVSRLYLYHFDFYRFNDPLEWFEAGFNDTLSSPGISIIEWPEMAKETLPQPDLYITLYYEGEGRIAKINAFSDRGVACLSMMSKIYKK